MSLDIAGRFDDRRDPTAERNWLTAGMAAAFGVLSLVLHLPGLLFRLFNSDEASLATMAMVIERGGKLYHQTADRKPPVVPYIYAGVFELFGTHDLRPVRVLMSLVIAVTAILLGFEAMRRWRSREAAVVCTVLFLLGSVSFFPADTQAAGFEVFMLLPLVIAFMAADRDRPVIAGVALALACLTKQTAVTTAIPIAYLLWKRGGLRQLGIAGGTGAGVVAVTAIGFGPSEFLLWVVTGNGGYVSLRGSLGSTIARGMGMTSAFIGINIVLVVLAVVAGWSRRVSVEIWLWLASGVLGVFVGARFFGHYYLQVLPPLVLAGAAAVPLMTANVRRLTVGLAVVPAVVMVGVGFLPPDDRGLLPYGTLAREVRRLTDPDERVFVWGEYPEMYWASDREPATRFIHNGFLTGNSGGREAKDARPDDGVPQGEVMLAEDFDKRRPDLVVDTTDADIRNSKYFPLVGTPLWARVSPEYTLVAVVDRVKFYRHNDA